MAEDHLVRESGLRLDRFLASQYPDYARTHFQDLIARGLVKVDGATRASDYRLKEGQIVSLERSTFGEDVPFEDWVLREDAELLALNKPAGLLMHPVGETWLRAPEAALGEAEPNLAGLLLRFRPKISKAGTPRCGLVHRLDRGTSGVLVVAKTPAAHASLVAAFAERLTKKVYRAIVLGAMEKAVEVEAPLGRPGRSRRIAVTPYGRSATTSFKVIQASEQASLVEARPITGRTHQIRAHFAHLKHPVLGDVEWTHLWQPALEKRQLPAPPRLMLHAYRLTVPHPRTGAAATFTAPQPKDFGSYWKEVAAPETARRKA